MLRVVEIAIKMSIQMKYHLSELSEELRFNYSKILKEIVSKQILAE